MDTLFISPKFYFKHCDYSQYLSEITNCKIYLKKDFHQFTGSFKERCRAGSLFQCFLHFAYCCLFYPPIRVMLIGRGARNALIKLGSDDKKKGVIAASAGNHALALAWHGKDLGIPVICIMPNNAPMTKVDKCKKFGAKVILHGEHIGEARDYALREYPDMKYINGYDHPDIIAGAGTMGIEIMDQIRDVDVVLVPVGGAGLIAGWFVY
jgi:threonine dehydratase